MKTLIIIIAASFFLLTVDCGLGSCSSNAQSPGKAVSNEEPKTVKLKITGMTCAGCTNGVATALKELDGVLEQKVEYPGNLATVKYNPAKTSVANIIKAIEKLGYKADIQKENKKQS